MVCSMFVWGGTVSEISPSVRRLDILNYIGDVPTTIRIEKFAYCGVTCHVVLYVEFYRKIEFQKNDAQFAKFRNSHVKYHVKKYMIQIDIHLK